MLHLLILIQKAVARSLNPCPTTCSVYCVILYLVNKCSNSHQTDQLPPWLASLSAGNRPCFKYIYIIKMFLVHCRDTCSSFHPKGGDTCWQLQNNPNWRFEKKIYIYAHIFAEKLCWNESLKKLLLIRPKSSVLLNGIFRVFLLCHTPLLFTGNRTNL